MDNPNLVHLIPSTLQNKKEILFGNLPEIYEFHNRHVRTAGCPVLLVLLTLLIPLYRVLCYTSYVHRQEKSSSLCLCVCPIKPMCRQHP